MTTKEEILESITGALSSNKTTTAINIPIGWIFQAMQQYADQEAKVYANWLSNQVIAGRTFEKLWYDYKNQSRNPCKYCNQNHLEYACDEEIEFIKINQNNGK